MLVPVQPLALPPLPPAAPPAATPAVRRVMQGNRHADTKPEILLRSELHRRGLRFRKNLLLRLPDARVRPDIVFTRAKLAVFVDGCFWHSCPEHGNIPSTTSWYWEPKLERNVARDRRNDALLSEAGWRLLRVWSHEDADDVAVRIEALVVPPSSNQETVR